MPNHEIRVFVERRPSKIKFLAFQGKVQRQSQVRSPDAKLRREMLWQTSLVERDPKISPDRRIPEGRGPGTAAAEASRGEVSRRVRETSRKIRNRFDPQDLQKGQRTSNSSSVGAKESGAVGLETKNSKNRANNAAPAAVQRCSPNFAPAQQRPPCFDRGKERAILPAPAVG